MRIRNDILWLFAGFLLLGVWAYVHPTTAFAAFETCSNGQSAPCAEDPQLDGCTQCHTTRVTGGNRNGTDRIIMAATGVNRHIDDPKIANWTSLVQTMIDKGSPSILVKTAGYLNTNYCTTCNKLILGSPDVPTIEITSSEANVYWSTSYSGWQDEPADTVLWYGLNQADVLACTNIAGCPGVSVVVQDTGTLVTQHMVHLTGLTGNLTQYFIVNQSTSSHGTVRSTYTNDFRTKRGGPTCDPEDPECQQCTGGEPPIPSRLYVSNNASKSEDFRFIVIDPITQTQVGSLPSNGTPGELAAHPDGSTLYAVEGSSVGIIDVLGNLEVSSLLGVGDLFNLLAVSSDGNRLYLVYRKTTGTATLIVKAYDISADPTAPMLLATITDPMFDGCYGPLGLAVKPDGSQLYLACRPASSSLPDRFYMINTATHVPTQTDTFARDNNYTFINAMAVSPDGSKVYLARASNDHSTVEIFSSATGVKTGTIDLPNKALPRAGAFTPAGDKYFIADQRLGTHVINAMTDTYLSTLPKTQSRGLDITLDPDGVHLYTSLSSYLYLLDKNSDSWVATLTGDWTSATQLESTPGREGTPEMCEGGGGGGPIPARIYASNRASGSSNDESRIIVIDPVTNTQTDSISVVGEPNDLAAHPDGSTLYAVEGKSIGVIDVLANIPITTLLGVGDLFNLLAVSPDGNKLYLVYRKTTGTATLIVKVFDLSGDPTAPLLTATITDPLFDGCYGPLGIVVKPDNSQVYLACRYTDNSLPYGFFMIDASNTVTRPSTFTPNGANYTFINAMAVSPDGSKVYLARASNSASKVEIFDGGTGANTVHIGLPNNALPRAIAVTPDGSKLYVADQRLGTHVINATTNTYVLTMPQTQSRGLDIAMSLDGSLVYPTLTSSIFVLDTATNTWQTTITGDFTSVFQIATTPGNPGP
jgi:DNA-binding beta-propeller fold protein YncE